MCLTDKHIEYVKDAATAYEMMKSIESIFERKSMLSKLYIRRQLLQLKCKDDSDLQDHFVKFDSLIRELESTGTKLEEDDKVCHLLLTMSEKYETVITVLEITTATLTLEFVKSKLLDVELKMKNGNNQEEYKIDECSFNASVKYKCYICGKPGHFKVDCPRNRGQQYRRRGQERRGSYQGRERRNWNKDDTKEASLAKEEVEEKITFIALTTEVEERKHEGSFVNFVIDSGATNHLVCEEMKQYMHDVIEINPVAIKIANGQIINAHHKGKLKARCMQSNVVINVDALIVNKVAHNLLSVQKIIDACHRVCFEKDSVKIVVNNVPIICKTQRNLFMAKFKIEHKLLACSAETEEKLWHLRLGHLNRRSLQLLGLPANKEVCESCKLGKATRLEFRSSNAPRSGRVGELLYADIWGPAAVTSLNGERYYQSITDDFSHFSAVYLLKNKSQAEEELIKHIEQLNANNKRVSRIRTDKGGEFMSNNFRHYCNKTGIKQEYTLGYAPQQCGVTERLNRTLLDKVRSMFVDTNLPKSLWGKAVRCAVYQLNRSPTRALNGKIPGEIFLGKENLKKMRIFGSKAWAYKLPKENKLEPRATEVRMVGYAGAGYRVWNPKNNVNKYLSVEMLPLMSWIINIMKLAVVQIN